MSVSHIFPFRPTRPPSVHQPLMPLLGIHYPCPRAVCTAVTFWTARVVDTGVKKRRPCSRAVLVTRVSQVLTRAVFTGVQNDSRRHTLLVCTEL